MKSIKTIILVVIPIIMLFTIGCESDINNTDTELSEEQRTPLEQIESRFTLKDFSNPSEKMNEFIEAQWYNHNTYNIEGKTWYQIDLFQQNKPGMSLGRITDVGYTLLATFNEKNSPIYFLTKISSINGDEYRSYFDLEKENFSGSVTMYDLKGNVILMQEFIKGSMIAEGIDIANQEPGLNPSTARSRCTERLTSRDCTSTADCNSQTGGSCGGSNGGSYVYMFTGNQITDWWLDRGNHGGVQVYEYSHYSETPTYGYVWVPSNGTPAAPQNAYYHYEFLGSGGYVNLGSEPQNTIPNKIHVDEIDDECVKTLIAKLRYRDYKRLVSPNPGELQGGAHLSQIILDMFAESDDYHIKFRIADATDSNGRARNAYTDPPRSGQSTFTITLDEDYVERATHLAIARTIIHESLHAFLYNAIQRHSSSPFSNLFYEYIGRQGISQQHAQHILMTEFATAIGQSLAIMDGRRQDQSYYNSLGWSGDMLNTQAFEDLPEDEQTAIENANNAEGSAVQNATSNARGQRCN